MRFNLHLLFSQSEGWRKTLTIMRISFFMFFVCLLQLHATNTYSQEAKLNIESSSMNLRQLFSSIEKQSDYLFFYVDKDVDGIQVSVDSQNKSINAILDDALKNTPLSYAINDRHVTITRKEEAKSVQQTSSSVSGTIVDATGVPAIGVSVKVKNTTRGTVTDLDGKYTLQANQGETLVFYYVGYKTQEIVIGTNKVLDVILKDDTKSLDEVVVVGYGTQKKVNLTGAVSTVKMDDVLGSRPVSSSTQALEGAVPGLQIIRNDGKPGTGTAMNIRGVTSINNSSQGPLVLVDHVPMSLDMVDPNDIESISVLKDAGAAAIYGARAAFGIVLVTTKRAKKDTPIRVNYSNNFAFSKATSLPKKIDPYATVNVYNDLNLATYYGGQNTQAWLGFMDDYYNKGLYPEGYTTLSNMRYNLAPTDVYKDMLDDYGFQQQHNASISGGTAKTTYRASFGMVDQNGILAGDKDTYSRYNMSAFLGLDANKWLTGQVDIRYTDSNTSTAMGNSEGRTFWEEASTFQPMAPLGYGVSTSGEELPYNTPRNLIAAESPKLNRANLTSILGRAIIKPMEGLEIIGEYSFSRSWASESMSQFIYRTIYAVSGNSVASRTQNNYSMMQNFSVTNAINLYGTYKKSFQEAHNITLMAGYNQENNHYESLTGKKTNLIDQSLPSLTLASGTPIAADGFTEYAVRGVFYRVNYDYKGRYLIETNGRYDGSSRFNKDGRFGFFPSVSAGWRVSEEPFMESTKDYLSNLKLRGSYGTIGNQNVSNYGYLPTMGALTQTSDNKSQWILPGQLDYVTSMASPGMISTNYTWETVATLDFGFDLGLFNNQFNATFDWYQRDTKDMLAPAQPAPSALGTAFPNTNAANLRTKGWELSLQWNSAIGKDIRYNIGVNAYDSQTEITKYDNPTGLLINTSNSNLYLRKGMKYGEIWGYTTDRYYTSADLVKEVVNGAETGRYIPATGIPYGRGNKYPNPGDIIFKDYNGDGIIDNGQNRLDDSGDMTIIGNNTARLQFGINGGVSWKNFDLSFMFTGVGKRDLALPASTYWGPSGTFVTSVFDFQTDYWTEDRTNAYWPRIYGSKMTNIDNNDGANNRTQTKYLLDGSYIRLQNVTLGYSLPKNICNNLYIENLRVFFSGENLYTWDHLPTGFTPDAFTASPGSLNMSGSIAGDSKYGFFAYPLMRQLSFGLNLIF